MTYSAIDIAYKVIASTDGNRGETISNLKLQKLLYYLQGFFLVIFDKKLFEEPIEAWQYGPVVREAYLHFRDNGASSISLPPEVEILEFNELEELLFNEVLEEYGQFSAIKLMNMTHSESPWSKTFSKCPQGEITEDLLREFFQTRITE